MKKKIVLFLATIMCLCLCACGGGTSSEEKPAELKDLVVGTWVREYTFEGKYFVTIINIYKGGTGTFQTVETEEDYEIPETIGMADSTTWEIVDDVLNIEIAGDGFIISNTTMGFVYYENEDEEGIQTVDGTKTYYRQAE